MMSHGTRTELYDVNKVGYDYNKVILDAFTSQSAPHLINVLKLVAIQACR